MSIEYLGKPGKIGSIGTKNRLVMTAMGVGVGDHEGNATDAFIRFYTERAKGGAGLIITEITRVNEEYGIGEYNQLSLAKDATIPSFKKLAESIHQYDTKIFAQLQHPGRETSIQLTDGKTVVSSSPIPSAVAPQPTRALEIDEVKSLVHDFAAAAARAKKAGMDGIEIHAGHGYLIQQFLSANDNSRDDIYGGSLENRQRFLVEIITAIRESCGSDFPISVRLSTSEFLDAIGNKKGITLEESVQTAIVCEKAGADFLNLSAGTHLTGNTIVEPTTYEQGWKVGLASEVRKHVSIPVAATGVIRDPEYAESLLKDNAIDYIAMGRSWLADPEWGVKALANNSKAIRKCTGCMYCFETAGMGLITGEGTALCSINPYMANESLQDELKKDGNGRKVIVVGAGPAGMESSIILAERGFEVILYEKNEYIGGQLYLASKPPHRAKMANFISYCENRIQELNVDLRLGIEVTADEIKIQNPYAVIIASGSEAILPKSIPGINGENVYVPEDILTGKVILEGKKVVVAGAGLTGMETAEYLQVNGNEVVNIDMLDSIGGGAFPLVVMDATANLAKTGVRTCPGHKLSEINKTGVVLEDNAGIKVTIPCDAVVVALSVKSVNSLYEELSDFIKVIAIGDAKKSARRMADAIHEGFKIAYEL